MTTKNTNTEAELLERAAGMIAQLDQLEDRWGSDRAKWPAGQRERADRLAVGAKRLSDEIELVSKQAERYELIRTAAADPANRESGFGGGYDATPSRTTPWSSLDPELMRSESAAGWSARAHDAIGLTRGLVDSGRSGLADMVDAEGQVAAQFVVAASSPAYRSAFAKIVRNPERGMWLLDDSERAAVAALEHIRASLATTTATGGWTIPLALQPGVTIANTGAANPFRQIATVNPTISSPARMLKSTGVTAEWKSENAAAADASPTFSKVDVNLFSASAYVSASFELMQDSAVLADVLPKLLADATNRLEASAFATGDGTSAPAGIVTRVAAVTASRVSTTTASTFNTAADIYKVWDALPPRARQSGNVAWIANTAIISKIRQFDIYGGSSFWTDLSSDVRAEQRLLGAPIYEASAMDSTVTTGSNLLLAGDFGAFHVFDHVVGANLQYLPATYDPTTGRPVGAAGWHYFSRSGSDCADETQFRVLRA